MTDFEHHISLAVALAVGLLIGLEREHSKSDDAADEPSSSIGGVRTYPLFALVGAISTLLASVSTWFPLASLAGVIALLAISYSGDVRRSKAGENHGATSEVSILATFLLGGLATSRVVVPMEQRLVLVAGLGIVVAFLLSSKPVLHKFAGRVSRQDYFATLQFLIVAVIVVPLLPNRDLGPADAVNPRSLGMLVVIISALSFVGYIAMRLWGELGLLAGAALGALVSSTAVTLSFARRVKAESSLVRVATSAIAVAWAIMLVRVGVVVAVIDLAVLRALAIPLGMMSVAAIASAAIAFRRGSSGGEPAKLENPFELGGAIKVTLMFALVLVVTALANEYFGAGGVYVAAALGGTTDVDAATLSSTRLAHQGGISAIVATTAITIAIAVNTVVKSALAGGIGGRALGARVGIIGLVVVAAGGAGLAIAHAAS